MYTLDNPKYPVYDNGQLHISISFRNGKLGNIPQFNTLSGDEPLRLINGRYLTNIKGTCGECCSDCKDSCYAIRISMLHHNTIIPAWSRNTVILRNDPDKVKREISEYCRKNIVKYFRFHTSGELENAEHLNLYCDICRENDDVIFYIYTKRFDLLADYFVVKKNPLPDNFIINLSEWNGNIEKFISARPDSKEIRDFFDKLNIFAYDEGRSEYSYMIHCPAIDKTGHETGVTCAQCRRCMKKESHVTAVFAH